MLWEPRSKQPRLRRFEQQLFSISGVSGGSLGAVIAYAALADAELAQPDRSEGRLKPPCLKKPHDSEWFGSDQGQKKKQQRNLAKLP